MISRLFLAEKPSVAQVISKSLGMTRRHDGYTECGNDIVSWCFGHMLEQKDPDHYISDDVPKTKTGKKIWRAEDLPIFPTTWVLEEKADAKKQIAVIKSLLGKAKVVVNAGDPDREGQLLVDELLDYFKFRGEVLRYWASAQDDVSVKRALADLKPNKDFRNYGETAKARSCADWLIGMNLSRAYTIASQRAGGSALLAVGRVQTPTLAIVVQRDLKIENFKPVPYWRLIGRFKHEKGEFRATWKAGEDQAGLDEDGRLIDEAVATKIASSLSSGFIEKIEKKSGKKAQPKCWSLADLQIAASKKHGLKADEVLEACQALYETHKLTSYPRTDCPYLPESQHEDAPAVLAALKKVRPALGAVIDMANPSLKSKTWDDKKITAHHGIIPTQHVGDASKLSKAEKQIYDMVVNNYLAQFFPSQEYENTTIDIKLENGEAFRAKGKVVKEAGWTVVFGKEDPEESNKENTEEDEEEAQGLPAVSQGDPIDCLEIDKKAEQTKPPARFTDGSLIEAMVNIHNFVEEPEEKKLLKEDDGIGTPATRDTIIKSLKERGYIAEKGKQIISTPLGRNTIEQYSARIKSPTMTAIFEREFKKIDAGELSAEAFLKTQQEFIAKDIEQLKTQKIAAVGEPKKTKKEVVLSEFLCPECKKPLIRRPAKSKGNFWWGCSGFPECKKRLFDNNGKPKFEAATNKGEQS